MRQETDWCFCSTERMYFFDLKWKWWKKNKNDLRSKRKTHCNKRLYSLKLQTLATIPWWSWMKFASILQISEGYSIYIIPQNTKSPNSSQISGSECVFLAVFLVPHLPWHQNQRVQSSQHVVSSSRDPNALPHRLWPKKPDRLVKPTPLFRAGFRWWKIFR